MSGAGDLNGDNYTDFMISSPYDYPSSVAVIYGNASLLNTTLTSLTNATGFTVISPNYYGDFLGTAVNVAGDVNGDGLSDIIIAALQATPSQYYFDATDYYGAGEVYVIYGATSRPSNTLDLSAFSKSEGFVVYGDVTGDFFGFSVSSGGRFDGSGEAFSHFLLEHLSFSGLCFSCISQNWTAW